MIRSGTRIPSPAPHPRRLFPELLEQPATPPTPDPLAMMTLAQEALELEPTTGPWKIDTDFKGDDWLVVSLERSAIDERQYTICTDNVRASALDGDARSDAEYIVWCRNHWSEILRALGEAAILEERQRIDRWNAEATV